MSGCGTSGPHFDGSYNAGSTAGQDNAKPGALYDLFVEVSGPPGATVEAVTKLIPYKSYPEPKLVHAAAMTGFLEQGSDSGWPVQNSQPLHHQPLQPDANLTVAMSGQKKGIYVVSGVDVEVSYHGRSYTVRAISPFAIDVGGIEPVSLQTQLESVK